jgi:hypothetical protein
MIQPDPKGTVRITTTRQRKYAGDGPTPYFLYPAFSRRETKRLTAIYREALVAQRDKDQIKAIDLMESVEDFLRDALLDWQHVQNLRGEVVAFDPSKFEQVIDDVEMGEITGALRFGGITEADLKNFDSPSPSPMAPVATAAPADAEPEAPANRA